MTLGLDYSWSRPPSPAWLPANGYSFVCRYLSYDTTGKNITLAEYEGLKAAGVAVVLNWEEGASDFDGGAAAGAEYAAEAKAQAQALGAWPCPIYFSKDENTGASAADEAYLQACAQQLGDVKWVGIYGSNAMVQWAMENGLVTYGWANVWDAPPWYAGAQLQQTGPGASVSWGSVDINQATAVDFGQVGDPLPGPEEEDVLVKFTYGKPAAQFVSDGKTYIWIPNSQGVTNYTTIFKAQDLGPINGLVAMGVPADPTTARMSGQPWPVTGPAQP